MQQYQARYTLWDVITTSLESDYFIEMEETVRKIYILEKDPQLIHPLRTRFWRFQAQNNNDAAEKAKTYMTNLAEQHNCKITLDELVKITPITLNRNKTPQH